MEGKFLLSSIYTLQNFPHLGENGENALTKVLTFARWFREAMPPACQQRQHLHHDRQLEEHPAAALGGRAWPSDGGSCPRGLLPCAPFRARGPERRAAAARRALSSGAVLKPQSGAGRGAREDRSAPRPRARRNGGGRPRPRRRPRAEGGGEETGEGRGRRSMRAPLRSRGPGSRSPFPPSRRRGRGSAAAAGELWEQAAGESHRLGPLRQHLQREGLGLRSGQQGWAAHAFWAIKAKSGPVGEAYESFRSM